jgi:hypothetical protein
MRVPEPTEGFVLRIDEVGRRLEALATLAPAPHGLTEPDKPSGEQWEWGQVWAHLGEFVSYWMGEIKKIIESDGEQPVPFGRVKTNPVRVEAIEADRHRPPRELMERLASQLRGLRVLLTGLTPEDWQKQGVHETLGVMNVQGIVDMFLAQHLEDHAEQLNRLVRGEKTG